MESNGIKLKVKNYSMFYGSFQALRDITIDIPINQITSIIGLPGVARARSYGPLTG